MGLIIGMGLGAGIYDFDLLRRSAYNYIVATLFSVVTAQWHPRQTILRRSLPL